MKGGWVFLLQLFLLLYAVHGAVRYYEFDVRTATMMLADSQSRPAMVVNGQFPGPTIDVLEGDLVEIKVKNNMGDVDNESLTIHWHGIHQRGTPYSDGVSVLTQCAIPAGKEMKYSFTAYPSGTHFWHSHMPGQAANGISGALIVRKTDDPYLSTLESGDDFVLLVTDWFNITGQAMLQKVIDKDVEGDMWSDAPFQSALVNGHGGSVTELIPSDGGPPVSYDGNAIFRVMKGHFYRFRIINSGSAFAFHISIDRHRFKVIAVDGGLVLPKQGNGFVDSIVLQVGERCDILLKTAQGNMTHNNFYIRARTLQDTDASSPHEVRAVLRYPTDGQRDDIRFWGEEEATTTTTPTTTRVDPVAFDLMNVKMDPASDVIQSGTPFSPVAVHYNMLMTGASESPYHWGVNNIYFRKPDIPGPLLGQNVTALQASGAIQSHTQLFKLKGNEVVELFVDNPTVMWHPFHLHGHYFAVMALGDETTLPPEEPVTNNTNPVYKDTLAVPPMGWAIIRFYTDNPGAWFFHCHIEYHLETGMAVLFIEDDANYPAPPKGWRSDCTANDEIATTTTSTTTATPPPNDSEPCLYCYAMIFGLVAVFLCVAGMYYTLRIYFAIVDRRRGQQQLDANGEGEQEEDKFL